MYQTYAVLHIPFHVAIKSDIYKDLPKKQKTVHQNNDTLFDYDLQNKLF